MGIGGFQMTHEQKIDILWDDNPVDISELGLSLISAGKWLHLIKRLCVKKEEVAPIMFA